MEDNLIFTLGLTGVDPGTDLVRTIRERSVVIAYGSPDLSSLEALSASPELPAVPEPSSLLTLAGLGLIGLAWSRRRRPS